MHIADPLSERPDSWAFVLAEEGRQQRLVVCAGAGLSMAAPTNLPDGREVARRLHEQVRDEVSVSEQEQEDLLALADSLEDAGLSERAQQVLPQLADFADSKPNFGHRALAALVIEGALELLLLNWDTCVEFASSGRINSVVNDRDAQEVTEPRTFKLHGCSRRRGSLLVSTAQIEDPPAWALDQLRVQLATAVVLFLGIGDVPSYVRLRVTQLREKVADMSNVWVGAPDISDAWEGLLEGLPAGHQLEITADELLDALLRAYVLLTLDRVRQQISDLDEDGQLPADTVGGFQKLRDALEQMSGLELLEWTLATRLKWPAARPVLSSSQTSRVLLAMSILSAAGDVVRSPTGVSIADTPVEPIVSADIVSGVVVAEAERRASTARGRALGPGEAVCFVSAGHLGELPPGALIRDIAGPTDESASAELIEGAALGPVAVFDADRIISGDIPELVHEQS